MHDSALHESAHIVVGIATRATVASATIDAPAVVFWQEPLSGSQCLRIGLAGAMAESRGLGGSLADHISDTDMALVRRGLVAVYGEVPHPPESSDAFQRAAADVRDILCQRSLAVVAISKALETNRTLSGATVALLFRQFA